jgi:hypothetical protein
MSKRFQINGNKLLITLNVKSPRLSKSGKSFLIASTRGPRKSGITIKGGEVRVSANAFILLSNNSRKRE